MAEKILKSLKFPGLEDTYMIPEAEVYADENSDEIATVPLNADTLQGHPAADFAPAGYGLGAQAHFINDCNEAILNGWYTASDAMNTPEGFTYGWLFVSVRAGGYTRQDYYTCNISPCHFERYRIDGVWGEWQDVSKSAFAPALTEKFSPAYALLNPALNDLMNININGNFETGNMHRSYVGTEDASTLFNCPVSGGSFYAIREVEAVANQHGGYHTMVTLKEFYPVQGRKWYRMYDINQKAWLPLNGWREENTEALATKVNTQRTYVVYGMFVNDPTTTGGGIRGTGSASINIDSNGLARIDFAVMIEQAGIANENAYNYGINRDTFMLINPNIPTITPKPGGIVTFYNYDGTINNDLTGWGGTFEEKGSFWTPGRVYTRDDIYGMSGLWEQVMLTQGMRLIGTCYGTVNL